MPARRRKIDPETGDYVLEKGRPAEDDTAASAVYLALATPRGSMPIMPRFGSRFDEVRKIVDDTPRLVEQMAHEALSHLVEGGSIRKLSASATVEGSYISIDVSYVDRAGRQQAIRYGTRVG